MSGALQAVFQNLRSFGGGVTSNVEYLVVAGGGGGGGGTGSGGTGGGGAGGIELHQDFLFLQVLQLQLL